MRPYCYYQAIAGLIRQCKNLIIPLKTGRSGLINILLYDIFSKIDNTVQAEILYTSHNIQSFGYARE